MGEDDKRDLPVERDDGLTPEMLDAGVDCLHDLPELLGPSREEFREVLKRAFISMRRV